MSRHWDDLTPKDPVPAPARSSQLERASVAPDITVTSSSAFLAHADGRNIRWSSERVGAAVLNYTRFCGCGRCDSCLVGRAFLGWSQSKK